MKRIRLLLDEGMPARAADILTARGIVTQHVLNLNMGGHSDDAVIAAALRFHAVVVTLDSDFHQWLAAHQAVQPSVIRVRIERLDGPRMALLLEQVVGRTLERLLEGTAVSVTHRSIRCRRLPLP